jgi:Zn-dependent peptidase ImmA (M78 family)/DNA-binding XRE family transcriptional regulator
MQVTAPDAIDPIMLGRRLRDARRQRGLTQDAVARELGTARTAVVAMEHGQRRVQPRELVRLADLYGRPVHELVRPPVSDDDFVARFRACLERAPEPAVLEQTVARFQQLAEDYLQLERILSMPLTASYPPSYDLRGVSSEAAAEEIAGRERNRLGLGDGPIPAIRELFESDLGLRVFMLELPSAVDALFAYTEAAGGCIGVNCGHPRERQQMSMAHEYGHFVTRREQAEVTAREPYRRVPAEERYAHSFALAFLMPEAGLRRRFYDLTRSRGGRPTPADLLRLSHLYQVSFQALLVRLEGLKLLPSGSHDRLERAGFKVREAQSKLGLDPWPADTETFPIRYRSLAAEAYTQGVITEGQLAGFLRTDRLSARRLASELALAFGTETYGSSASAGGG